MIVLKQSQVFLKFLGLLLTENQNSNSDNIIFNIFYAMPLITETISIGLFYKNTSEMSKATEATYPILGISLYLIEYCVVALKKIELRILFADLQDIVDMSKLS